MPVLICIVVGLLSGLAFMRKGMYLACLAFVSVLLATIAGLGFGATVAHMAEVPSVYSYAGSVAGVAVVMFAVSWCSFRFVDTNVDFHPMLERIGGAAIGMMTGLLATGFLCACLLCAPLPAQLESARAGLQEAATLAIAPSQFIIRLMPGGETFDLDTIIRAGGKYGPDGAPPLEQRSSDPEQAEPEQAEPVQVDNDDSSP